MVVHIHNHNLSVELDQAYLQALIAGSGRAADHVVETALDQRLAPQQIYLDIFQQAAYAIGRLWQSNRVSVAQEHIATAIIERQMGELQPYFRSQRQRQRSLVLGCVPDEWHRVGARMVADFFEADGWTVHYLGANVPVRDLVGLARETGADMVGISAEMVFNLPRVSELVRAIDAAGLSGIPVIAGGMPFITQPELAAALSLRGSASDAASAVALANRVLDDAAGPATLADTPVNASIALHAQREAIAAAATVRCLAAGDQDGALIRAGMNFTLGMLEGALTTASPALLDAQVNWANERQPHDGVMPVQVISRLGHLRTALIEMLPAPAGIIVVDYVDHLIAQQQHSIGNR